MYKPGDMVANQAPTTSATGLLQSGGELNIVASMDGQEVYANKYGIAFRQSSPSTQAMGLYYGSTANTDSVLSWTQGANTTPGTTSTGTTAPDSGGHMPGAWHGAGPTGFRWGTGFYHLLDSCTSFNFVNCDQLYSNSGTNTVFKVTLPDTSFGPTNTQIFLILPVLNVMTQSDNRQIYDAATNTITVGNHEDEVPVGQNYDLVVIANKNGALYYYEVGGVITDGIIDTAAMAPDTRNDIVARLSGL